MPDTHPAAATVAVQDAENRLAELVERAERGEEIVLTRAKPTHDVEAAREAVERILAVGEADGKLPVTLDEILAWRHEGHRI